MTLKYVLVELERYPLYAANLCFNLKVKMTALSVVCESEYYRECHCGSCTDHVWLMHFDCIYCIVGVFIFSPSQSIYDTPPPPLLFSERQTAVQAKKPFHLH